MARYLSVIMTLGLSALVSGLAGCDSATTGSAASACAVTAPSSCPTSAPSYATDVAPLLNTYCVSCHVAGGQEGDKPLNTYGGAAALSVEVEAQVASCAMPPTDATQPTTAEMQKILDWIACGAQNN
jgi:hypothetical protein